MKKLFFLFSILLISIALKAQTGSVDSKKLITNSQTDTIPPSFPGGNDGWSHFLGYNLRYPKDSYLKSIQGRVLVQVYVEKDGSFTNFTILKSPAVDLSNESLRVIALSPKWKPATKGGKPIRIKFVLPVDYGLVTNKNGH